MTNSKTSSADKAPNILTFVIFRKSDNAIVHTLRCENYSEFRKYWLNQPAPQDFGYREIDPVPKAPYVFTVLKCAGDGYLNGCRSADAPKEERLPLTDELCERIAKFNGAMTAGQVHAALMRGQTVYTNFSCYVLE